MEDGKRGGVLRVVGGRRPYGAGVEAACALDGHGPETHMCLDRLLSVEVLASSTPRRMRILKKASSLVLTLLRGATYQTRVQNCLRCLSVHQEPFQKASSSQKCGSYLLASSLAAASLDSLFEDPVTYVPGCTLALPSPPGHSERDGMLKKLSSHVPSPRRISSPARPASISHSMTRNASFTQLGSRRAHETCLGRGPGGVRQGGPHPDHELLAPFRSPELHFQIDTNMMPRSEMRPIANMSTIRVMMKLLGCGERCDAAPRTVPSGRKIRQHLCHADLD
jgi:hypothetical protein